MPGDNSPASDAGAATAHRARNPLTWARNVDDDDDDFFPPPPRAGCFSPSSFCPGNARTSSSDGSAVTRARFGTRPPPPCTATADAPRLRTAISPPRSALVAEGV
uniref:Uncharacterized protein n=1 Tax=Oryza glumipatula TaxID=40148 RepID=A0A0E0BH30_9ORYZ